jgi:hypothetical protein
VIIDGKIKGLTVPLFFFLRKAISGSSTRPPNKKRMLLYVNGPMYSAPTRCAVNANPQMQAVNPKSMSARTIFLFML